MKTWNDFIDVPICSSRLRPSVKINNSSRSAMYPTKVNCAYRRRLSQGSVFVYSVTAICEYVRDDTPTVHAAKDFIINGAENENLLGKLLERQTVLNTFFTGHSAWWISHELSLEPSVYLFVVAWDNGNAINCNNIFIVHSLYIISMRGRGSFHNVLNTRLVLIDNTIKDVIKT